MDYLKKLKKYIIETAPSYEKIDDNLSLTSKMMKSRRSIGFTRIFYPGAHFEGELKYFERRHKTHYFKYNRIFGARGEILVALLAVWLFTRGAKSSLERENIDQMFCDRDTYYVIKNLDKDFIKLRVPEVVPKPEIVEVEKKD